MIELELTRDFCFFFFFFGSVIVNNVNKIMFGFMNEANFHDMNFLYRKIYMLYTCIYM